MLATLISSKIRSPHRCSCRPPVGPPVAVTVLLLLALPLLAGCGRAAGESRQARETWDAIYLQGKKVGHAHQLDEPVAEGGRALLRSTNEVELVAQRFGDQSRLTFKVMSWETPEGQLVRFRTESHMSDTASITEGRVHGNELQLEIKPTTAGGEPTRQTIAWSPEIGSFNAVERSLRDHPLKPGEQRTIRALEPLVNQAGTSELSARDFETTDLPAGKRRLLRVDRVTRLAGTNIPSIFWVDESGEVWKTRTDAMQQETFRTTREEALRPATGEAVDIGLTSVIRLNKPLPNAHQTQEVRYLVEMTDGDPSEVFPTGPGQSLRKLGPHSAELTVRAIRPGTGQTAGPAIAGADEPKEADRRPNSLIQSDDSRVRAMASAAAGDATDPWEVAKRLEAYVHKAVKNKNFSQALGSAAEVARSGEGDCTEHAVLLAALARARGIPARVALGLVYSDPAGGFAFHMWTEVYVRGKWVPIDATLGRGGIGAAHLKIAQSSLDGADHLASFLPVAQALGRLKLEVLSVTPGDQSAEVPPFKQPIAEPKKP
jgi:hypothetical protein